MATQWGSKPRRVLVLPFKLLALVAVAVACFLVADHFIDQAQAQTLNATQEFVVQAQSVTSAGVLKTFGFNASTIVVTNLDATNPVEFSIAGPTPTATTSSYQLTKGQTITLTNLINCGKISLIVASSTVSVQIGAWR